MNVSYKKCLRLLNTEDSFFSNKAVMDAYKKTTAGEYMILATLDRWTCEVCGSQDTMHYEIKDAKIGVNMPPFHPNCRCTTTVYFEDDDLPSERMMRDENGKSVKTDYMSYDEWKKKYVDKVDDNGAFESLTDDEKRAVLMYKSSESYIINEKLYNDMPLNDDDKWLVKHLDSALEKMPNYRGNLVRDLYFIDEESKNNFINQHRVGDVISYKSYVSTTKRRIYNENANVRIYIKDAKLGKDISRIGLDEGEVLYERNFNFKVLRIDVRNDLVEIILEEE